MSDGIDVTFEPINTKVDIPGYFYDTSTAALDIMDAIDRPNVKLQYDVYHMQIMEGDLARTIERLLPRIGHIQIADNPGRNEPGHGGDQLPLASVAPGRARLQGLGRLRVPPGWRHPGRPRLGQALFGLTTIIPSEYTA